MSLDQFLNQFRPFFQMLEDPEIRYGNRAPAVTWKNIPFESLALRGPRTPVEPAVDLKDAGDAFIVEADVPGVDKKDVDVEVGKGGRTLTIRGSVTRRFQGDSDRPQEEEGKQSNSAAKQESQAQSANGQTEASETGARGPTTLSSERSFVHNASFSRTVWFPRPVDANKISAQLKDGVLTVRAVKQVDEQGSKRITID